MKHLNRIVIAALLVGCVVLLTLIALPAHAFNACGVAPPPPPGMVAVCVCDQRGNCSFVFVKR